MVATKKPSESFLGRYVIAFERILLLWDKPLVAMLLAGIIFTGISATAGSPLRLSTNPFYNLLADAFIHGQLHLRLIPDNTLDLLFFQGRYYLYWGPLPAILAIPLVAAFGVNVSDVFQNLFFSSLTVGILAATLRAANEKGVICLSSLSRAILVLFFALGTPFTAITESGHVMFAAQVESLFFVFLAYLAAFKMSNAKAFILTGCAVAGILLTRVSAVFAAIFLVWYLLSQHWSLNKRRLFLYCVLGLLPILTAEALTILYNYSRFSAPFDNGYNYQLMSPFFAADFSKYGAFNLHFIPGNLYYTYLYYPYSFAPPHFTLRCGSLFLLSPLFLCAIYAMWKFRRRAIIQVLLITVLIGNIPLLLLMGPGSGLLGPRYALDFVMPLLLLTGMGIEMLRKRYVLFLVAVSVIHYIAGTMIYVRAVP
ncbi:MAG: hypothetical protein PHQ40_18515 [Anaerolineaceae bacterium]|nr:hypothetical protein [Anaerolineaceae bacterium]